MSIYPTVRPSLTLDFKKSKQLDPRISFSRSSSATYVEGGVIKTADEHQARFEDEGLLIEESRTNLIPESILDPNSGLSVPAFWFSDGFSSPTQVTDPSGSNNAYQYLSTGGTVRSRVSNAELAYPGQPSSVVGQEYAFSIFVKTVNYDTITFGSSAPPWATGGTGSTRVLFNLTTGEVVSDLSTMASVTSASMTPCRNGWWRLAVTTVPATDATFIKLYIDLGGTGSETHTTSEGLQVFGAQIEAGAFPTSYIPTAGSELIRSEDICTITGDNFSSWYNPNEGSLFIDMKRNAVYSSHVYLSTAGGGYFISDIGTAMQLRNFQSVNFFTFGTTLLTDYKIASSYLDGTGFNTSFNGSVAAATSDTATFAGIGLKIGDGDNRYAAHYRSGHSTLTVARLSYYPERLTDEQLEVITS